MPLIGNFDPPIESEGSNAFVGSLTNQDNPLDTTRDGQVTTLDALVIINALRSQKVEFDPNANPLRVVASMGGYQLDVSQDRQVSALDVLLIINAMEVFSAESEQVSSFSPVNEAAWTTATEQVFERLGNQEIGHQNGDHELMPSIHHGLLF